MPARSTSRARQPVPDSPVDAPPLVSTRWRLVDSLRGFALLGIVLVNALDITQLGYARVLEGGDPIDDPVRDLLYLTVQTRFVPIFEFLFGMSLWFVLASARERSARPTLVVLRRLVVLVGIGLLLGLVYPGNVLVEYGIVGLLALPLVRFCPRWAVLGAGAVLTVLAYALLGGGSAAIPGLVLLGAGAAAAGLPRALEHAGRPVAVVATVAAGLSVPALLWQSTTPGDPRFSTEGGTAGLVMAALYVASFALLWRTRARLLLAGFFEPLGRMAISNYVGAALVIAAAALIIDFGHMTSVVPGVALGLTIIAVQSVLSRLWLRHFVYGPVEWLWRAGTWWTVPTVRRDAGRHLSATRTDTAPAAPGRPSPQVTRSGSEEERPPRPRPAVAGAAAVGAGTYSSSVVRRFFFGGQRPAEELVAVLLPEPLGSEVDQLLGADRFVEAVRLVRRRTDLNLLPATLAVRHRQE